MTDIQKLKEQLKKKNLHIKELKEELIREKLLSSEYKTILDGFIESFPTFELVE